MGNDTCNQVRKHCEVHDNKGNLKRTKNNFALTNYIVSAYNPLCGKKIFKPCKINQEP